MGKSKNNNGEGEYFKREQVCLRGKTLKMFQYEIEQTEEKKSARLFEIVKDYYRRNPPFGYGSTSSTR